MMFIAIMLAFVEPEMSSKKASFDGQFCIFEENVILDHPFGRLTTGKAILEKEDESKFSFQKAWFEQGVKVVLDTGAIVQGVSAKADLSLKTFKLTGDVSYQECDGLQIKAQQAEACFTEQCDKFTLQEVRLQDRVSAVFPLGRSVICHEAYYKPGAIFDIKGTPVERCQLKDLDLNLKASSGQFDLVQEEGFLLDVEADLLLPISGVKSALHLCAEKVHFSDKKQMIYSTQRTFVDSKAYGLKSELDEFKVKLSPAKNIEEAVLIGHIHIQGPEGQTLDCPGVLKLHEGKQQLVLKANKGSFISCKTDELLIKASRARIFYRQDGNKFIPVKVELEDEVQLYDLRLNQKIYGRAHLAHLFMEEDRVHLYGHEQERVLYVDDTLDFRLSAPEVVIQKNHQGKMSVQGIGAVHFGFNDEEKILLEKIKKLFHE